MAERPADLVRAGFRGAVWDAGRMPAGVATSAHALRTADGATTSGLLFERGGERTVCVVMHPREFTIAHYVIPEVLRAGCACWKQAPRSPGTDLRLEHEAALLDVAAGVEFLRSRGFEKIVLLGNSGGAGLFAYYNEQALLAPARRIARTPGGRPVRLAEASLLPPDGLILLAPHPGQGALMLSSIDPSVVDEDDPYSIDEALSPFETANGFEPPPASSRYAPDFAVRYRAAQRARVERLDERCRSLIAERLEARRTAERTGSRAARIRAAHQHPFFVWRTDADLRCFDLSIDPSERRYGSLWGRDPIASNYGSVGFARICTPESWLSTWSGLSSNAALARTLPGAEQPILFIVYTGDSSVFPGDVRALFAAAGSADKEIEWVAGDHHGRPLEPGARGGRELAGERLSTWLAARFPVVAPVAARGAP
jgi:pimeloyl-ACP methyl ester carboxylesterase